MIMSVITMNLITLTVIITTSKLHTIHSINQKVTTTMSIIGSSLEGHIEEEYDGHQQRPAALANPSYLGLSGLQNQSIGGSHQTLRYSSGMVGMIVSKALNFSIIFTNIGKVAAILQAPYWKNRQLRNQMERRITKRYVSIHLPAARRLHSASLVVFCRNSDQFQVISK